MAVCIICTLSHAKNTQILHRVGFINRKASLVKNYSGMLVELGTKRKCKTSTEKSKRNYLSEHVTEVIVRTCFFLFVCLVLTWLVLTGDALMRCCICWNKIMNSGSRRKWNFRWMKIGHANTIKSSSATTTVKHEFHQHFLLFTKRSNTNFVRSNVTRPILMSFLARWMPTKFSIFFCSDWHCNGKKRTHFRIFHNHLKCHSKW